MVAIDVFKFIYYIFDAVISEHWISTYIEIRARQKSYWVSKEISVQN